MTSDKCPNCGRCPHCGHVPQAVPWTWKPYPWTYPTYPQPVWYSNLNQRVAPNTVTVTY